MSRMVVRPIKTADFEATEDLLCQSSAQAWRGGMPAARGPLLIQAMVDIDDLTFVGVAADGKLIGLVSIHGYSSVDAIAHLSVLVDERMRRTRSSLQLMFDSVQFAFERRGLRKLYVEIGSSSLPSVARLTSSLLQKEGTLSQHLRTIEGYDDLHIFSLDRLVFVQRVVPSALRLGLTSCSQ